MTSGAVADRQLPALADALGVSAEQLLPALYDSLRRTAHRLLQGERPGHTLNTTALVQGVRVYAVDPVAGLLVATEVDHPDEAIRRQVFLRLRGGPSLPHAAPIVDPLP